MSDDIREKIMETIAEGYKKAWHIDQIADAILDLEIEKEERCLDCQYGTYVILTCDKHKYGGITKEYREELEKKSFMKEMVLTQCWKCSSGYDRKAAVCPVCGATNANVDQKKAAEEAGR